MNDNNYCVYIHTLITDDKIRRYVGLTGRSPEIRWANGKGYTYNLYFYNSIQKYGWNNFKHEIIKYGLTKEEAGQLEIELISKYNTTNKEFGFNKSLGGETNSGISGYKNSRSKIVLQFDLDGNFIKEYGSGNEAANKNNLYPICIINCCNKKLFSSGGYLWCYKENFSEKYIKNSVEKRKSSFKNRKNGEKPILMFDKNKNFIKRFRSGREISRIFGYSETAISANARYETECVDNKYILFFENNFDKNSFTIRDGIIDKKHEEWKNSYEKRSKENHFNFGKNPDKSSGAKLCICDLINIPVCRKTMKEILIKNNIKTTYNRIGTYLKILKSDGIVVPQKELSKRLINDFLKINLRNF